MLPATQLTLNTRGAPSLGIDVCRELVGVHIIVNIGLCIAIDVPGAEHLNWVVPFYVIYGLYVHFSYVIKCSHTFGLLSPIWREGIYSIRAR